MQIAATTRSYAVLREEVLPNDLAEAAVRVRCLEADVEVDRSLYILVPKHATHELVISRFAPQDQCGRSVPELVSSDPQAGRLFNSGRDLLAEHLLPLVGAFDAGKDPKLVCPS